jgi:hypothetical protein
LNRSSGCKQAAKKGNTMLVSEIKASFSVDANSASEYAKQLAATIALDRARAKLYSITGGSLNAGDVRAAQITTEQRIEYFHSPEFQDWVDAEYEAGRQVFWLRDVDKTQAAGDVFTFFYKWRADNKKFTPPQLQTIQDFLTSLDASIRPSSPAGPQDVIDLWLGNKIGFLDFWHLYWKTQIGLTRDEKLAQVAAFAPSYEARVYPGIPDENRALALAGVRVVIVSNGDQELAQAIAPILGISSRNAVGSNLIYDDKGVSTGVNHAYEVSDKDWFKRPQPGKTVNWHYWLHQNDPARIDNGTIVIGGRDGDSANSDGGMMILCNEPSAIGNFMFNTPGEPDRIETFYKEAAKYGFRRGQFITVNTSPSQLGREP